jgi:hypothetical protein
LKGLVFLQKKGLQSIQNVNPLTRVSNPYQVPFFLLIFLTALYMQSIPCFAFPPKEANSVPTSRPPFVESTYFVGCLLRKEGAKHVRPALVPCFAGRKCFVSFGGKRGNALPSLPPSEKGTSYGSRHLLRMRHPK